MLGEHPAWVPVVRDKRPRVCADPVVVQDRPVLEQLPRRAVAAPASLRPLRAVVGHAGGRPVQDVAEPLLAPGVPLGRAPVFALLRLRDEPRRVEAVPRPAEAPAVQRGREGARRRRQAMVQPERETAHQRIIPRVRATRASSASVASRPTRPRLQAAAMAGARHRRDATRHSPATAALTSWRQYSRLRTRSAAKRYRPPRNPTAPQPSSLRL